MPMWKVALSSDKIQELYSQYSDIEDAGDNGDELVEVEENMGKSKGVTVNVSEDLYIRIMEKAKEEHEGDMSDAVRSLVKQGFECSGKIDELEKEIEEKDERINRLLGIVEELSREK